MNSTSSTQFHGTADPVVTTGSRAATEPRGLMASAIATESDTPRATTQGQTSNQSQATNQGKTFVRNITVNEVKTRSDRRAFVELPWQIYQDDPHWVPPLRREVHSFINRKKHPFYQHGEATQFIARRNNQVVGRILVSDDPNYNEQYGTNLGCFGMFECIDDQSVADELLNRAASWLKDRGRTQVLGPIDYSTNYPCGLLIDGFDTPPRIMMNHQPAYYQRLLENWGLTKSKDMFAWWFDDSNDTLEAWGESAEKLARRFDVKIRNVDVRNFDQEVQVFKHLYNACWDNHWGMVKMTDAEFDHLASQLRQIAKAEMMLIAEVKGEPVGICITLPDINEAIRPLNGNLFNYGLPTGLFKLLRNMKRIQTARLAVLGVLEGYRRRGVAELMILRTLDYGKNRLNYQGAELGWTLEENEMVTRTVKRVGGIPYKTYRILERDLV